jgi:hypothetical protein
MKEKSIPGYNQAANIDRNACLETARRFHFGTEGIIIPAVNSFMEKSDDLNGSSTKKVKIPEQETCY